MQNLMGKKKKKKKGQEPEFNVKKRLDNVKILIDTGRPKEAIAYIYLMYNDIVNIKL